jgi:putative tryptophan/tyrosine transport system substrate-binding protein
MRHTWTSAQVEPANHLVCYARNADAGQLRGYIARKRPFSCPGRPPLNKRLVGDILITRRLPGLFAWRDITEVGGLMSYSSDYSDTLQGAAGYVDRMLKGAKPADLPVQQPTKYELLINLKTAKALGLSVPPTLLARADEVIE